MTSEFPGLPPATATPAPALTDMVPPRTSASNAVSDSPRPPKRLFFIQESPTHPLNFFEEDMALKTFVFRMLPEMIQGDVTRELSSLSSRVCREGVLCGDNAENNPPSLQQYNVWGQRLDHIHTSPGWQRLKVISAEEGLVATGYERRYGACSRLVQFYKLYLFHAATAFFTCPLAMTDGAARALELSLQSTPSTSPFCSLSTQQRSTITEAFSRLTSRLPSHFITSGQWMTEKTGGSDVSNTETDARQLSDGSFCLHGDKWFTSATDSEMALTLARIITDDTSKSSSTVRNGLSLFYLPIRDSERQLNNIKVNRLKDKLGTRAVPTAELRLRGTRALLLSAPGRGVAAIATMINVTRVYNSVGAVSLSRYLSCMAIDYAHKRKVFGKLCIDQPLHCETLASVETATFGSALLVFDIIRLMGHQEVVTTSNATVDKEADLLRLLIPLAKLFTAKEAIACISELMECFGGQGYQEDSGIPRFLRDAQVLPIWEGTTNILSLDVLRALLSSKGRCLDAYADSVSASINLFKSSFDPKSKYGHRSIVLVQEALRDILSFATVTQLSTTMQSTSSLLARDFSLGLSRIFIASMYLRYSASNPSVVMQLDRWCETSLVSSLISSSKNLTHVISSSFTDERHRDNIAILRHAWPRPFHARTHEEMRHAKL